MLSSEYLILTRSPLAPLALAGRIHGEQRKLEQAEASVH